MLEELEPNLFEEELARKVDFGEGRFRFEHSYRHPRHFHLICQDCGGVVALEGGVLEQQLMSVAEQLGFSTDDMQLSLLALVVIPELRISDLGLVDVTRFAFSPVLESPG